MNKSYTWTILIVIAILITITLWAKGQIGKEVNLNLPADKPIVSVPAQAADSKMSFFITSVNPGKGGDLGGLAGADAYCLTLAESVGVNGKTWRAYLSTTATGTSPTMNARDRIGTGPWYNSKGALIASTLEELDGKKGVWDFTANNLNKQTALTEKGDTVSGRGDDVNIHDMLTGSDFWGMASTTAKTDTTCSNWTSSSDSGSAIVGHHDRMGINDSASMKAWNSSHASRGCSLTGLKSTGGAGLFYCFAQ